MSCSKARVAKLADARDLKSRGAKAPCRFDSDPGHHRSLAALGISARGSKSRGACISGANYTPWRLSGCGKTGSLVLRLSLEFQVFFLWGRVRGTPLFLRSWMTRKWNLGTEVSAVVGLIALKHGMKRVQQLPHDCS